MSAAARAVQAQPHHIQAAMARMRRPHWPEADADVLAHPCYGPCVRGLARNLARAELQRPAPPRPAARRAPRPTFDARRAAANDLDD